MNKFNVRKVGVLGAGVMGAQIAAHLANVGVPVILFDLPAKEGPRNAIADGAVAKFKKMKPAPLASPDRAALIQTANYDDHLELLKECDLIIEAIAERMDWKHDLYSKVAPFVAPHAVFATNTSGLSINELAKALPAALKPRFCGIHFFNPPRYMYLIEIIPADSTDPEVLDMLETISVTKFGKGVVRAKDTPNFVANRIGVGGSATVFAQAEKFGLTPDIVDDLTGKRIGRASSATFRTADVVGLDILANVLKTMEDNLKSDPFHYVYEPPAALATLLNNGALGQKAGAGFFKKVKRDILRFDADKGDYVPAGAKADKEVTEMLKLPAAQRLKALRDSDNPQAQFVWAVLRDSFHYAAVHLEDIAESARDIDLAMRWGFAHKQGPFEIWQEAGWTEVASWIKEDIDAGKALCDAPLPSWVFEGPVAEKGIHSSEGSWSPSKKAYVPRSNLPVYDRQLFPEEVQGSATVNPLTAGTELFRNEAARVWTLDDEVAIISILTKMNTLTPELNEAFTKAIDMAETSFKGLVIWTPNGLFSAGANLQSVAELKMKEGDEGVHRLIAQLHEVMLRLRYAQVPVVGAMQGLALGGGCELAVHCARRVATMETYMGLVEVGVGLIPAGGGLTYIARRAAENALAMKGTQDFLKYVQTGFEATAMAKVSGSALEAKQTGFLLDTDVIVPNRDELLYVALMQAKTMYESGYVPPAKVAFPVGGRDVSATIKTQLVNMRDGGFISEYDFHLSALIADVICGGDVDGNSLVTEEYLMKMERDRFVELTGNPKTQERVMGMLQTGKPVRN